MEHFISLEKGIFFNPFSKILGIIDKKDSKLSNILLEKRERKLYLTSTNTEMQIQVGLNLGELIDNQDSMVAVSGKKLSDILKSFSDNDKFSLTLDDEREKVRVSCLKSKFNLLTYPQEDFPLMEFDFDDVVSEFEISQYEFKNLLKQIQYSISTQDGRYYLMGASLKANEHKVNIAATDGNRLSYASITIENEIEDEINVIIPRKCVLELIKLLDNTDAPLKVIVNKTMILFQFNDIELMSLLIDAKYPDYEGVIPKEFNRGFMIERSELIQAIQRVAIISENHNKCVELNLKENNLTLLVKNAEQEQAKQDLEIEYNYENLKIGFNIQYLLDCLTNLTCDNVVLRFIDEDTSCLITTDEFIIVDDESDEMDLITLPQEKNGDENLDNFEPNRYFKYVVMPMRI